MNGVSVNSMVGLTSSSITSNNGNMHNTSVNSSSSGDLQTSISHSIIVNSSTITNNLQSLSDDDDDEMPSSPESFDDDEVSYIGPDDVTAQLAAAGGWAGPVGLAAAAAIASAKKRKRHHCFELNPSIRKRQQTRLLRKLKATIDEYSTRVGQQAVVVVATPSKSGNNFKCFGAKPLEDVMKTLRQMVMTELENALAQQAPPPQQDDPSLHELPPLVVDGIPTPVEKMTQAQLRAFIPLMLKYSTGRGKPGWGKESTRPPWWPKDVPWANVRMDARSEDQKQKVSWTTALRQIVISCYKFHGRDDLLPAFNEEEDKSQVQHHHQTTVTTSNSIYSTPVVQTISNPDGTVSIIQVDPNNPVIHLPDGTTAHVQGMAQAATQSHVFGCKSKKTRAEEPRSYKAKKIQIMLFDFLIGSRFYSKLSDMQEILSGKRKFELTTHNGDSVDNDSNTVAIDINQVSESMGHEGTIIFTQEDGTQIPVNLSGSYPVSGMITLPLPVYQTVVANIQSADGQHLQVVSPLIQVPKLEPGLENGVEVSSALNATLDGTTIIASHMHSAQVDDDDDDESIDMVDTKSE